jgi:ribosomal protein L29
MKVKMMIPCLAAGLIWLAAPTGLLAQESDQPARPNRQGLAEQLKNLTPEERRAKLQEWRGKHGAQRPEAFEKLREELKNMSPEERQARIKELRDKHAAGTAPEQFKGLAPEERRAKIKEKLAELRRKQADGTITPHEEELLKRAEERIKGLEENSGQNPERKPPADKK